MRNSPQPRIFSCEAIYPVKTFQVPTSSEHCTYRCAMGYLNLAVYSPCKGWPGTHFTSPQTPIICRLEPLGQVSPMLSKGVGTKGEAKSPKHFCSISGTGGLWSCCIDSAIPWHACTVQSIRLKASKLRLQLERRFSWAPTWKTTIAGERQQRVQTSISDNAFISPWGSPQ